jgi:hypothetical protein
MVLHIHRTVLTERLRPAPSTRVPFAANHQNRGPGRFPDPDKVRKRDARSFSDQDYVRRWSPACVDFVMFHILSFLFLDVLPVSVLFGRQFIDPISLPIVMLMQSDLIIPS